MFSRSRRLFYSALHCWLWEQEVCKRSADAFLVQKMFLFKNVEKRFKEKGTHSGIANVRKYAQWPKTQNSKHKTQNFRYFRYFQNMRKWCFFPLFLFLFQPFQRYFHSTFIDNDYSMWIERTLLILMIIIDNTYFITITNSSFVLWKSFSWKNHPLLFHQIINLHCQT